MLSDHVEEIRVKYAKTNCTFQSLADEFEISQTSVGNIIRGRIYPDLPGPTRERNMRCVLSDAEVKAIRKIKGKSHQTIAEEFGVSRGHISRILSNINR